jgi:hypothetical protein
MALVACSLLPLQPHPAPPVTTPETRLQIHPLSPSPRCLSALLLFRTRAACTQTLTLKARVSIFTAADTRGRSVRRTGSPGPQSGHSHEAYRHIRCSACAAHASRHSLSNSRLISAQHRVDSQSTPLGRTQRSYPSSLFRVRAAFTLTFTPTTRLITTQIPSDDLGIRSSLGRFSGSALRAYPQKLSESASF